MKVDIPKGPVKPSLKRSLLSDAEMCGCDRMDEADEPHHHVFDWACVYWQAGNVDRKKALSLLNEATDQMQKIRALEEKRL